MNERLNSQPERSSDNDLVDADIEAAGRDGRPIGDAAARMIAAIWHGGQATELYSFVSTGEIGEGLADEIADTAALETVAEQADLIRLAQLNHYITQRQDKGAVEGWSRLWLDSPAEHDDCCAACGEHFSDPHSLFCPFDPTDTDD